MGCSRKDDRKKEKCQDVGGPPFLDPKGGLVLPRQGQVSIFALEVNLPRFRASIVGSDGFPKILTSKEHFFIAFQDGNVYKAWNLKGKSDVPT